MSWQIPQGIEVLVKKASIDDEFRALLLDRRAESAQSIGLVLDNAETMMLAAVPDEQLEAIIAKTTVPQAHRRAFLGKAAAAMLAALGATSAGIARAGFPPAPTGIPPDLPPEAPKLNVESRVIAVVAEQFRVPKEQISRETTLDGDLKADPTGRQALHKTLQKRFNLLIPAATFNGFRTVGDVVDFVDLGAAVESQVVDVLAGQLKLSPAKITRDTVLTSDLKVDMAQLAQFRRELAAKFRVYLSWDAFRKLQTVGQVFDHVRDQLRRRQAAGKERPEIPSPVTRGSRPDVPRPGGLGGVRPGSPPQPQ